MTVQPAKILLLGAAGFIGQHLACALRSAGHEVLASARNPKRLQLLGFQTLQADLLDPATHDPDFWRSALVECSHVIHCAGLLTGSETDFHAVHVQAPQAVYQATPKTARAILISAVGTDANSDFAYWRKRGEEIAQNAPVPVTILRPGLVLAQGSYGGSSLARALAVMPLATPMVGDGTQPVNPIHVDDLAQLVIETLSLPVPVDPIALGGPETISQAGLLQGLRRWLGLRPVRLLPIPHGVAHLLGRLGDALRLAPISVTSVQQLEQGIQTDITAQNRLFHHRPAGFSSFINSTPSQTQDLWHARLFLLRPMLRLTLAAMWFISAMVGFFLPEGQFLPAVSGLLPDPVLIAMARGGGMVDLAIALALLRGWRLPTLAWVQFTMVGGYTVGLTLLAPILWADPFGGLLKNLPILVAILIHRVLEQER